MTVANGDQQQRLIGFEYHSVRKFSNISEVAHDDRQQNNSSEQTPELKPINEHKASVVTSYSL